MKIQNHHEGIIATSRYWIVAVTGLLLFFLIGMSPLHADGQLPDFTRIFEQESKAVVRIEVTATLENAQSDVPPFGFDQLPEPWRRFFEIPPGMQQPSPRQAQGFGSGFIFSEDGYIITNAHVVNNATNIVVGLQDQKEYTAELIGSDTLTDVALLKIAAKGLPVATFGDSDTIKVGQWVLAIGAPFGFDYTATQGIVSAVARNLPSETYVPFIQTDVAVNPGNSGGPLLDGDGKVIGVNSQIYSRTGGYQGLSFAIPVNVVESVVNQLRNRGQVSRGWLGVSIQNVDQTLAESFGLERPTGALIASVSDNSPAQKAGLKSGDIILEFNDRLVVNSGALPPMVGVVSAGKSVPLKILRDGRELSLDVTIAELDAGMARGAPEHRRQEKTASLGLVVSNLTAEQMQARGIDHGVQINEVEPGSPAASAGLRAGDVILSLDRNTVSNAREFASIASRLPTGKVVPILVQRADSALFLGLKIPK